MIPRCWASVGPLADGAGGAGAEGAGWAVGPGVRLAEGLGASEAGGWLTITRIIAVRPGFVNLAQRRRVSAVSLVASQRAANSATALPRVAVSQLSVPMAKSRTPSQSPRKCPSVKPSQPLSR